MDEQQETKIPFSKKRRTAIILCGFAVLIGAIFAVTTLTARTNKPTKQQNHTTVATIAEVRITKNGFEPATMSVHPGTKVIWTNVDQSLHQVAANPYPQDNGLPGLKSEILNNSQTYTYIAGKVGTFGYHDQLQPTINGTLVVQKQ